VRQLRDLLQIAVVWLARQVVPKKPVVSRLRVDDDPELCFGALVLDRMFAARSIDGDLS
jgi:hypothetical protein